MKTDQIKLVLISITIFVAVIFTVLFFNFKFRQLKNDAVSDCLTKSGIYEYTDTDKGVKTTAPQKEFYIYCMADKGYPTAVK